MGRCYEMGKGTEADMEKARRWYTLAAEQGRPDAAYKLGQFYEHGIGVEEDMEKAEEWYQKAAEEDVEEENFHNRRREERYRYHKTRGNIFYTNRKCKDIRCRSPQKVSLPFRK